MDCSLNYLAEEENVTIKGQKKKGCPFTHCQGFKQARNCKGKDHILSYDTTIKILSSLIGIVRQQLGKSEGNN